MASEPAEPLNRLYRVCPTERYATKPTSRTKTQELSEDYEISLKNMLSSTTLLLSDTFSRAEHLINVDKPFRNLSGLFSIRQVGSHGKLSRCVWKLGSAIYIFSSDRHSENLILQLNTPTRTETSGEERRI